MSSSTTLDLITKLSCIICFCGCCMVYHRCYIIYQFFTMDHSIKKVIIDVFIFTLLSGALIVLSFLGQPYQSGFWCEDVTIRHQYKPDTFSTGLLLIVARGGTILTMCLTEAVRVAAKDKHYVIKRSAQAALISLAKASGSFFYGSVITNILAKTLKLSVGRLRPHFIALCRPNVSCPVNHRSLDLYVTDYHCTNTEVSQHLLHDSRQSFPSGHASNSVYCALFLIFYLQLRMETTHYSNLIRPAVQLCPLVLAILICVSRVTDNKHFPSDVTAGAIIGSSVAWLVFYKLAHSLIPSPADRKSARESDPGTPSALLSATMKEEAKISRIKEEGSSNMSNDQSDFTKPAHKSSPRSSQTINI